MRVESLDTVLTLIQGRLEESTQSVLMLSEDELRYVDIHSGGVGADPEKVRSLLVKVFPVIKDAFFLETYDRLVDRVASSRQPITQERIDAFKVAVQISCLDTKYRDVFASLTHLMMHGSDGRLTTTIPYAVHAKTALLSLEEIHYFTPFCPLTPKFALTRYKQLARDAWQDDGAVLDRGDRWGERLLAGNVGVHSRFQTSISRFLEKIKTLEPDTGNLPRITGPSSSACEVLTGLFFGSIAQFRLGPVSVGISQYEFGEKISGVPASEKMVPDFCVAVVENRLFQLFSLAKFHVLSHELGHAVAGLLFGARDVRIHVCDGSGGVVNLILPPETASWKQTVIDAAGPLANVAFSSALIAGAVSSQEYISTQVAGVLTAGSLSWMFGEGMYAITSAVHMNSGDFGKIAQRGPVHLTLASLSLAVIVALGVWNFLQFFTFDTDRTM